MTKVENPLVMLVDDSKVDLFLNQKFLDVSHITNNVIPFLSARKALQYLEDNMDETEKLPLLILLDVKMPDINGFQFLDHFNKMHKNLEQDIKIIMLSSTIDPVDLDRARDNDHVFDILRKPLNPNQLKELLIEHKVKWVA